MNEKDLIAPPLPLTRKSNDAATPENTILPAELKDFQAAFKATVIKCDHEMQQGNLIIPETKPRTKARDIEVLESACLAFSLSMGISLDPAKKVCEENHDQIVDLAMQMAQHRIDKYEAIQQLVSIMQGNRPLTTINSKESRPVSRTIDINTPLDLKKRRRDHRDGISNLSRILNEIGLPEEEEEEPLSLQEGIVIYMTKESDQIIHEMIAHAMGIAPNNLLNMHKPAGIEGYDYRREIPLTRPTTKIPRWTAMGRRIDAPGTLVRQIKEKFPDDRQVKIEIAPGVKLE